MVSSRQLEDVYNAHYDFVWRSVVRLGAPDPDDALQEVFIVIARRLPEFEGRSNLRTWLFAICMRIVSRLRRTEHRAGRRVEAVQLEPTPVGTEPHKQFDAARVLHQVLDTLSDTVRPAFIMAELEQMPAHEIAAVLQVKVPTVHSRLRLARAQVRRLVARHEAELRRCLS